MKMTAAAGAAILVFLIATTAAGQTSHAQLVGQRIPQPVYVAPVQATERVPLPEPVSASNLPAEISPADVERIARAVASLSHRATALTRPTSTYPGGATFVQPATSCESGECLQIDLVDQPAPVIDTEMQTIPPAVQMVPRHVPPPPTHSLQYGFDQNFPQLPIVDVDNDCGCGNPDHYEVAVICIDGKPTQVLNPEPPERNCVHVFIKNVADLVHGRDE